MRPTTQSTTVTANRPAASSAGHNEDEDASSVRSTVSQDTNMSDIDDSMGKSARDASADVKGLRVSSGIAKLIFGAGIERVRIETARASNARADRLRDLVIVFVGGTGGIGKSTAIELFRRATTPRAYIVGRSEEKCKSAIEELSQINPGGQAFFIQKDVSCLKNVDDACEELQQKEQKINCLFLTAGYLSVKGRDETPEGLDRKMATNYYSRIRWATNLLPQLTAASEAGEISRVLSVLAAGSEGDVQAGDLDLRKNFSLHACMAHCVVMTDFMMEELAKRYKGTTFIHSYPGTVKTGIANELTGPVRLAVKVMYAIMSPWILNVQESGERHLFQLLSQCYPAANGAETGLEVPNGLHIMRGSNGETGSGAYLLDWDGKPTGDQNVLGKYRAMGFGGIVWEHTMQMFERAQELTSGKPYKRPAEESPENSQESAAKRKGKNPVGWRSYQ